MSWLACVRSLLVLTSESRMFPGFRKKTELQKGGLRVPDEAEDSETIMKHTSLTETWRWLCGTRLWLVSMRVARGRSQVGPGTSREASQISKAVP